MKRYIAAPFVLILLVSACARKANDPADAKAIQDLLAGFSTASAASDTAFFENTYYLDDAIRMQPNGFPLKGKKAILEAFKNFHDAYTITDTALPVDEILSSGDLAVARGTAKWTNTPNSSGLPVNNAPDKWVGVYQRQADGSWKCAFDIWNSDEPAAGATTDGSEEKALYQLERDWAAANARKDIATVEKFLAKDFVSNYNGRLLNKAQLLAAIKSNPAKIESAENTDMTAMVFGDTAVVRGIYTEKSTTRGKDTTVKGRYTEVYSKRDGRWQCVTQYATMMQ